MKNNFFIKANSHSICYNDSEKATLPIIFIHGFPFNKSSWEPQFLFLRKTHRVIVYDLPGFGESIANNQDPTIGSLASDLIKFMDALKIEKAIVCGLSMGGYILLNAVEHHPERFEAIILSDTQCAADTRESAEKRFDTIVEIEKKGFHDFAGGFIEKVFSNESLSNQKEAVEKIKKIILSTSPDSVISALKAMANRRETCSGLKNILIPTLILCGEEDMLTPVVQSEFLFDNIPNSEMHVIKKAGHLSNLEQSEIFNDHLHNFISDIIL